MRTVFLALTTCLLVLPAQAQYSGGSGTAEDPYQIATAADLIALGERPDDWDKHFKLMADIDLSGYSYDRAVIAPDINDAEDGFQGTSFLGFFDGNGHTISNLMIEGGSYLGLFGVLGSPAHISRLGLEAVDVNGTGDSIGGLGGSNGTVWSAGGILGGCYASGEVSGVSFVGGLVGDNEGLVTKCFSTGTIRGVWCVGGLVGSQWLREGEVTASYSTCSVRGDETIGGLVGVDSEGTITTSYATGTVTGVRYVGGLVGVLGNCWTDELLEGATGVADCYSMSSVYGDEYVGGLIGRSCHGANCPIDCFWDIQASGQSISEGGIGETTAEMKTAATFLDAGWDFVDETENGTDDIWWILEGQDYPRLWWEGVPVLVVDDFESHTDDIDAGEGVFQTWVVYNDHVVANGALVGHLLPPFAEQTIVHGGSQSMPFYYDNTAGVVDSWAERRWGPPRDWTIDDADALTLYFRGEADNDPEPLYVAIEDDAGQIAVVTYPGADAVQATEWQRWHIPLAELQAVGVDVAAVEKMIIGVGGRESPQPGGEGLIYIDDIRLTNRMP